MTLERKPSRRDPRVLALVPTKGAMEYATLDSWEILGTGCLPTNDPKGFVLQLRRIIVQTRPTAIVYARFRNHELSFKRFLKLAVYAMHTGIPLVSLANDRARELIDDAPTTDAIAEQYPELRALGVEHGADAVRLASAALTSLTFPPRTYDTSNPSRSRAALASGAAPGPRRTRVPRSPSDRSAAQTTERGRRARPRTPRS